MLYLTLAAVALSEFVNWATCSIARFCSVVYAGGIWPRPSSAALKVVLFC